MRNSNSIVEDVRQLAEQHSAQAEEINKLRADYEAMRLSIGTVVQIKEAYRVALAELSRVAFPGEEDKTAQEIGLEIERLQISRAAAAELGESYRREADTRLEQLHAARAEISDLKAGLTAEAEMTESFRREAKKYSTDITRHVVIHGKQEREIADLKQKLARETDLHDVDGKALISAKAELREAMGQIQSLQTRIKCLSAAIETAGEEKESLRRECETTVQNYNRLIADFSEIVGLVMPGKAYEYSCEVVGAVRALADTKPQEIAALREVIEILKRRCNDYQSEAETATREHNKLLSVLTEIFRHVVPGKAWGSTGEVIDAVKSAVTSREHGCAEALTEIFRLVVPHDNPPTDSEEVVTAVKTAMLRSQAAHEFRDKVQGLLK